MKLLLFLVLRCSEERCIRFHCVPCDAPVVFDFSPAWVCSGITRAPLVTDVVTQTTEAYLAYFHCNESVTFLYLVHVWSARDCSAFQRGPFCMSGIWKMHSCTSQAFPKLKQTVFCLSAPGERRDSDRSKKFQPQ